MRRPFDPDLLDFLETRILPEWSGTVWREVLGETDPLRPNQRGARWNPAGVSALYTSLDRETARAEIDHLIASQSIPVRGRRHFELTASLTRIAELDDLSALDPLGVPESEIRARDHSAPRRVGHAVAWLGCAGLLVPSLRHEGTNLVIYTDQMAPTDSLELA